MGVAALVCGIISVVCAFFGFGAIAGIVLGIIAIILGIKAKKDPVQAKQGTAGMVLGIIGTVLSGILFLACVACVGALGLAGAEALKSPEVQDAAKKVQDAIQNL